MGDDSLTTSAAMLEGLRDPQNREAWARFFDRYQKVIRGWCRKRGLQATDAEDVTQRILLLIMEKMRDFTYDPEKGRFRDWLSVVTRYACMAFHERDASKKYQPLLGDLQARDDLERLLQEQSRDEALAAAAEEVKKRVAPRDWRIFDQVTFAKRPAAELAAEHEMSVAAVFKAASRVRRKVREQYLEFGGLEGEEGDP